MLPQSRYRDFGQVLSLEGQTRPELHLRIKCRYRTEHLLHDGLDMVLDLTTRFQYLHEVMKSIASPFDAIARPNE